MTITNALKRAIAESGESLYRLAEDSGVDYAVLYRFAHGERDLYLATADRLAEYLGLELQPRAAAKQGEKQKKRKR